MKKVSFDFIIVGGGTAGSVTASKLVKSGAKVLIIEEGGANKNPFLQMPAAWITMLSGSPYLKFHKSIPQPQLNGRQHDIAQAKILGGGSSVNAMVYMRGKPSDYEKWKESTKDPSWEWGSIIKNYIQIENNQRLNNKFHGIDGPLTVSDPAYVAKGSYLYIKSMQELGLPYNTDFNNGEQYGVGLMQYTIGDGIRSDCVKAFLNPLMHNPNLRIFLKTIVTKIIIENHKAIGVEIYSQGKVSSVYANNEIILTAGSIISPKLLMLSGIGDEEELKKHNIKLINKLPGVGKNLQDHHEIPFVTKAKGGYGYFRQNTGWRMIKNGIQYLMFRSGPVTSCGVDCCAFLNPFDLSDAKDPPIKLYCVQIMYTDRDTKNIKLDHGVTLTPCLMNPKARGEIKLKSSDPMQLPLINPNFLSNEKDIKMLLAGVKLARQVIHTRPLSDIIINEILPGSQITSDNELINYCKKAVKTNWHPVGTCKMGNDLDKMSVLNSKLQVFGVENLRVFDVSMMPNIIGANTNAPAMAIADKATDMLLNN